MADNPETPDDEPNRDEPEAPRADASDVLPEGADGPVPDDDPTEGGRVRVDDPEDVRRTPPSMGGVGNADPDARRDDRLDGAGRTEPTTSYPHAGDADDRNRALDPTADVRDGALDDVDETARTVVGVPVGESGIDPAAIEDGAGLEPPEPPIETTTFEVIYTQIAGFVGARDGPDEEVRPLATNATTLEVIGEGNARVETDRMDTTITAMRGRGYELRVSITERFADRDSDTGGTTALVEIVEADGAPTDDTADPQGPGVEPDS